MADCRSGVSASAHRASGPGAGIASQTNKRKVPGAWNVGGFFLCGWEELCCQYGVRAKWRKERGSSASTARNSKRRHRVDSEVERANTPTTEGWRRKRERSRQREFMTAGADRRARHRDAGAVSGNSGWQAGGRNLSTRRTQRFLAEVESSGTSARNARSRR